MILYDNNFANINVYTFVSTQNQIAIFKVLNCFKTTRIIQTKLDKCSW